jgi:hypothetical protein
LYSSTLATELQEAGPSTPLRAAQDDKKFGLRFVVSHPFSQKNAKKDGARGSLGSAGLAFKNFQDGNALSAE